MLRRLMLVLVLLALPSLAHAQTQASYTLRIYTQIGAAVSATSIPGTLFTCGQPRNTTSGTMHNPTTVNFIDPADGTKDCIYTDTGSGPLAALPNAPTIYVASLAAVNSAGVSSTESSLSNTFDKPAVVQPPPPPPTPVNVRVK
jgi:hypothetical protein